MNHRFYTQDFLDNLNLDFFYDYIDNCKHVAILSGRMTGKTILSEYFLLYYLIKNNDKTTYFTSRTQIHQDRANEILYHINKSNNFNIEYNIKDIMKGKRAWYGHINNLIHASGSMKIDLVVIDEINSHNIKESHLDMIKYSIHKKGTKLLINGMLDKTALDIIVKLGIEKETKIIDEDFIKNMNHYSRGLKIKRIIEKSEKGDNSICV